MREKFVIPRSFVDYSLSPPYTSCCLPIICGLYQKLKLQPEELIVEQGTCLAHFDRKREYALLGFVKRSKVCVCCRQVSWEEGRRPSVAQHVQTGACVGRRS